MATNHAQPSLTINYSPNFELEIACIRAQEYAKSGMPGVKEYFFDTSARVWHPTGHFEYRADDICFDVTGVEQFAKSLVAIRDGRGSGAKLSDVGGMLVVRLDLNGRRLHCVIDIREFQAGEELTVLHEGFRVDYDLFVNKLSKEVAEFAESLKNMTAEEV